MNTKQKNKSSAKEVLQAVKKFMASCTTLFKEFQRKAIRKGQASAVKLPPSENIELEQLPEVVSIREYFQGNSSELRALFIPGLERLSNRCESAYQQLIHGDLTLDEYKKEISQIKDIQGKRAKGISQKYQHLKDEKQQNRKETSKLLGAAKIKLSRQIKHAINSKKIIGWIVYVIIVIGEVLLNSSSFNLLSSQFMSILISLAFSVGIVMISHGVAQLLTESKLEEQRRISAIIGLLALVAIAFYTLSVLKSTYVSVRPYHAVSVTISPFLFWTINAILFCSAVAVKVFIFPRKKQLEDNENYATVEREVKHLEKTVSGLTKDLGSLETEKEKELKLLDKESKQKQQVLTEKFTMYVENYNSAVSGYNQVLANLLHQESYINSFFKNTLSEYIEAINESRIDGKQLLFTKEVPSLSPVFTNYQPKKEFQFNTHQLVNPNAKASQNSTSKTDINYKFINPSKS